MIAPLSLLAAAILFCVVLILCVSAFAIFEVHNTNMMLLMFLQTQQKHRGPATM
jgi:hypothetical protein